MGGREREGNREADQSGRDEQARAFLAKPLKLSSPGAACPFVKTGFVGAEPAPRGRITARRIRVDFPPVGMACARAYLRPAI
jgi:hypothetical protein